jgi:hypothetical protein
MMNAVNSNTGNVGTPIINTLFGESLARQEGRFVAFTVQPAEGGFIVCNGPRVVLCTTLEQVGTVVMGQVAAYQLDQMEKDEKTRR